MPIGSLYTDLSGSLGCARGTLFTSDDDDITDLRSEANLVALYDASNTANVTVDSVGRVSQWSDTSLVASNHLLQGTAASQPIYLPWSGQNYGYGPGANSNYFSTPDSAAVSVTGDIDLRWWGSLDDWTPASTALLMGKWLSAGNQRSYRFDITATTGILNILVSADGLSGLTFSSSVAPTVSDGAAIWVRATLDVDNGAGGKTATFYTSTDGITWTQLGTTSTTATAITIFDGTAALNVNTVENGGFGTVAGKCYRAQVLNGIDGTVVADFNPSLATDGSSSFVAATGETWTVNSSGGKPAQIVGRASVLFDGVDDVLKTAAFTLNQPETVYFVGKQLTWTLDDIIYDGDNTASSGRMALYQSAVTPALNMFAGTVLAAASPAVNTLVVHSAVFNGASSLSAVNRGAVSTGSVGAFNAGGFTLGAEASATARWSNIQVCACVIFSVAHDARTRARVINYLVSKYSIPV